MACHESAAWKMQKYFMRCLPKSSHDIFCFQVVEVFKDVPVERPVERVIEVVKEGIEFRRIYLSCFRAKHNIGCLVGGVNGRAYSPSASSPSASDGVCVYVVPVEKIIERIQLKEIPVVETEERVVEVVREIPVEIIKEVPVYVKVSFKLYWRRGAFL